MSNSERAMPRPQASVPAMPDGESSSRAPASALLTPEEFAALFAEARARIWLIAAAVVGNRTEADDVVQEAAMIALGKLGEFSRGTSFEAWMGQIVRNVARNTSRKKHRRQALDRSAAEEGRATGGADGTGRESQESQIVFDGALMDGLATLEESARICLLLRVVGELPYRTIATIAGVPEGTAMSHVHRGRERLRRWVLDRGLGPVQKGGSA